jgi:hypothetical protein
MYLFNTLLSSLFWFVALFTTLQLRPCTRPNTQAEKAARAAAREPAKSPAIPAAAQRAEKASYSGSLRPEAGADVASARSVGASSSNKGGAFEKAAATAPKPKVAAKPASDVDDARPLKKPKQSEVLPKKLSKEMHQEAKMDKLVDDYKRKMFGAATDKGGAGPTKTGTRWFD